MNRIIQSVRRFQGQQLMLARDTRGLSTVEYVIILVLIAALAIGTWRTFGSSVKKKITESTTGIDGLSADDGKSKSGPN
jgi:Flp pilus assembly pilin Flp